MTNGRSRTPLRGTDSVIFYLTQKVENAQWTANGPNHVDVPAEGELISFSRLIG